MRPNSCIRFFACTLLLVGVCQVADAVGLGSLEVHSRLGQPLDVTIPLVAAQPGQLDRLEVGLATDEDFARVGMERPFSLSGLEFSVQTVGGRPVVRVMSPKPIREPFVTFLMRVDWPTGQMLRQYTVLLDPPITAPAAGPAPGETQPVAPEVEQTVEPLQQPAPVIEDSAPFQSTSQTVAPAPPSGEYGPVAAGETLWGIANQVRPAGVSVNRMMLALLRANPDAFYSDNISALKRGAVLRVPAGSELDRLTVAQVLEQVRRQNDLWQNYRRSQAQSAPAVVEGGEPERVAPEEIVSSQGERVELLPPAPPQESLDADQAVAGEAPDEALGAEELRRKLARTQEELLARREQTGALDSRVVELEEQVADLRRLLDLRSSEMAALQDSEFPVLEAPVAAREVSEATEPSLSEEAAVTDEGYDPFADEFPPDDAVAQDPFADEFASGDTVAQDPFADAQPESVQSQQEAPLLNEDPTLESEAPAATLEPTVPETDEVEVVSADAVSTDEPASEDEQPWWRKLTSPLALGILALILVGGLAALFLHRRRGESDYASGGSDDLRTGSPTQSADELPDTAYWATADEEAGGEAGDEESALRSTLELDPQDTGIRLKLMEVLKDKGEHDAFVAEAETLYAQLADPTHPTWQEARRMGEEIAPEHSLFGGDEDLQAAATDEWDDAEDELLLKEDEVFTAEEELPEPVEQTSSADETLLRDQDLSLDDDEAQVSADRDEAHEDFATPESFADEPQREYELSELATDETPTQADTKEREVPADLVETTSTDDSEAFTEADQFGDDTAEREVSVGLGDTTVTDVAADADESDEDFGDLSLGEDDAATIKLELAEAYFENDDPVGARSMLEEVLEDGNERQKQKARELLARLD